MAGAGQHPFDTCQWIVLRVSLRYTRCIGLPTQFRLNVGPVSQPIAGSMPKIVHDAGPHYSNTGFTVYLAAAPQQHVKFTQYCFIFIFFLAIFKQTTTWSSNIKRYINLTYSQGLFLKNVNSFPHTAPQIRIQQFLQ